MTERSTQRQPRFDATLLRDSAFALLLLAVVVLLLVPMPALLLDGLLTLNLGFSVLLLLVAVGASSVLELRTFPTLLLIATVFRLALNISSTRLILADAYAGRVIEAFGQVMVRGDLIVGVVVFAILVVVQFVVIARGGERVAEVAARFSLDAMPGRQMGIDADLRSGQMTQAEATRARTELRQESDLYGALDGAMKFVRGDAIAAVFITSINVLAGVGVGVARQGLTVSDSINIYTRLTIGDGLVSMVPSILIAVAAAVVVTRGRGDRSGAGLGSRALAELSGQPALLIIMGVTLLLIGLLPGMPALAFVIGGLGFAGVGWRLMTHRSEEIIISGESDVILAIADDVEAELAKGTRREQLEKLLLELKDRHAGELGVTLPAVKLITEGGLSSGEATVRVRGLIEASARVKADDTWVDATRSDIEALGLHPEPIDESVALRINDEDRQALKSGGLRELSLEERLGRLVDKAVQRSRAELIRIEDVKSRLARLSGQHPELVEAAVPGRVSASRLTALLRRLASEGIALGDLRSVLESLTSLDETSASLDELVEATRGGMQRSITAQVAPLGMLKVVEVHPSTAATVREAHEQGSWTRKLRARVLSAFAEVLDTTRRQVVLVEGRDRVAIQALLGALYPRLIVVAKSELLPRVERESVGVVRADV